MKPERWTPPPVVTLESLDTLVRRLGVLAKQALPVVDGECWCGTPATEWGWCARCLPLARAVHGLGDGG